MSDENNEPLEPSDGDEVVTGVEEPNEDSQEKETKPDAS